MTFGDGVVKIYFNGINQAGITNGSVSFIHTNTGDLEIGRFYNDVYFFNGTIFSAKIYNRTLSAEEIKWSYREPYAIFERGELLL